MSQAVAARRSTKTARPGRAGPETNTMLAALPWKASEQYLRLANCRRNTEEFDGSKS